jgi:uncharacterized cupredoxin-like copper-binding protein
MTHRRHLLGAAAATLALPALAHGEKKKPAAAAKKEQKAWGIAGDARAVKRTIRVRMQDTMRFEPDALDIKLGETVRIDIRNDGKMLHELVIGTKQELEDHAALMLKFPNMEHDEPYMAHVDPGKSGAIVWHFNRAGNFEFACLIAGHYQAGMKGTIAVKAA